MSVGTDGDDTLVGGAGNETLDGGAGNDWASYATATTGVVANLLTGVAAYEPKIMPLGDSITYGIASLTNGGYRGPLWNLLQGAGVEVNFVGSNPSGNIPDPDNEGHGGWTINDISGSVAGWLTTAQPDVVMLIIGTNDTSRTPRPTADTMIARLSHLIDQIETTQAHPPKLLIGPSPPMNDAQPADRIALIQAYDALIPDLVAQKRAAGMDVTYVDMSDLTPADITAPPIDPGVHPNPTGYAKIANDWYQALMALGSDNGTLSGTPRDHLVSIENLQGSQYQDVLIGNDAPNQLVGLGGADILDGRGGADTMIGGQGDDTYIVDNPGDQLVENVGEGVDTVKTGFASFSLPANFENITYTGTGNFYGVGNELANVLTGGPGNDTLDGGAGRDTLVGGAGDDLLISGPDFDQLDGGAGNDTYIIDLGGETVVESLSAADGGGIDTVQSIKSFTLGPNLENLVLLGTSSTAATGNELANVLTGNIGNNTLSGMAGADTMIGMAGKDTYVVDNPGDVVSEVDPNTGLDAGGYDTVQTSLTSYTLPQYVEALVSLNTDPTVGFQGTGNELVNAITGGPGNDTLSGGPDSLKDSLIGGQGDDTYIVQVNDVIVENPGEGRDTVQTAFSAYALPANLENLVFTGTGAFRGTGNADANLIVGGAGNDVLDGGGGADTLQGGAGSDTYLVDDSGDVINETDPTTGGDAGGVDIVKATASSYTLSSYVEKLTYIGTGAFTGTGNSLDNVITGGAAGNLLSGAGGNDILTGGVGADSLSGDDGNDKLSGDAGADTLLGGQGVDVLTGGAGADQFLFNAAVAGSKDTITDFTQGEDKIAILASGFSASLAPGALDPSWFVAGSSATASGHGQFVYDATSRTLSWDADGLGGAAAVPLAVFSTAVNLQPSDFLLV